MTAAAAAGFPIDDGMGISTQLLIDETEFVRTQANAWAHISEIFGRCETLNGPGSSVDFTLPLRNWLPTALRRYNIRTVLDAPCGDWNWMQYVDLTGIDYTGWDANAEFVEANQHRWPWYSWAVLNLLTYRTWPRVDLIICRDFMIHLPNERIALLIERMRYSDSRYLLATSWPDYDNDAETCPPEGHDGRPGYWRRKVNLEAAPFNLRRVDSVVEVPGREQVLLELRP